MTESGRGAFAMQPPLQSTLYCQRSLNVHVRSFRSDVTGGGDDVMNDVSCPVTSDGAWAYGGGGGQRHASVRSSLSFSLSLSLSPSSWPARVDRPAGTLICGWRRPWHRTPANLSHLRPTATVVRPSVRRHHHIQSSQPCSTGNYRFQPSVNRCPTAPRSRSVGAELSHLLNHSSL